MRVALLHNLRPVPVMRDAADDVFEEYDSPTTIAAIAGALRALGIDVEPLEADRNLPLRLKARGYDIAFNIAEGFGRRCREALTPALCELFYLPYTGSDPLTLAITLDKAIARRVVTPELRVAQAALLHSEADEGSLEKLRYPVLVKPNDEGSSKGIRQDAVVGSIAEAAWLSRRLREQYGCPVLVEEFLNGVEVTVGIIGNGPEAEILGVMEISPKAVEQPFVYSVEVKRDWRKMVDYHVPARLPNETLTALAHDALTAYRLLGCRDFARIDFRLDYSGQPFFLECNALPGLDPDNSDLVLLSRHRMSYECLVQTILFEACKRTGVEIE